MANTRFVHAWFCTHYAFKIFCRVSFSIPFFFRFFLSSPCARCQFIFWYLPPQRGSLKEMVFYLHHHATTWNRHQAGAEDTMAHTVARLYHWPSTPCCWVRTPSTYVEISEPFVKSSVHIFIPWAVASTPSSVYALSEGFSVDRPPYVFTLAHSGGISASHHTH